MKTRREKKNTFYFLTQFCHFYPVIFFSDCRLLSSHQYPFIATGKRPFYSKVVPLSINVLLASTSSRV